MSEIINPIEFLTEGGTRLILSTSSTMYPKTGKVEHEK